MARLVGVDLPRNKRMVIALTYIYGIGPTRSAKILAACNISQDLRTDDLTEEDIKKLRTIIGKRFYAVPYMDNGEEYYKMVIE